MHFRVVIFLLLLHILPISTVHAQSNANIPKVRGIIGFSIPELLHVGARYQLDDIEIGVSVGSFKSTGQLLTLNADCIVHVFEDRNATGHKSWYGKIGFSSMHDEGEYEINDYVYTHLRFGHEFALSKTIGLQLDGGMMFELKHNEIQKKPSNSWFDFDFEFPVLPSIGLTTVIYL